VAISISTVSPGWQLESVMRLPGLLGLSPPSLSRAQDEEIPRPIPPPTGALSEGVLNRAFGGYLSESKAVAIVAEPIQGNWARLPDEEPIAVPVSQLAQKPEAVEFLVAELDEITFVRLDGNVLHTGTADK
jgi:hypothetical protein